MGLNRPIIIAGPCAVESLDSMLSLSRKLKSIGVDMLRGGIYKPRTSPYDFQGLGDDGLKILNEVSNWKQNIFKLFMRKLR